MLTPSQLAAVDEIAEASVQSQILTGCPAPLTAAQAIYESGYLSRCPGNNCFGIKVDAHGNGSQYVLTHEFLDGTWEEKPLAFETYASLADCFTDHARLIQSGIYEAAWDDYRGSPRDAADLDRYIAGVAKHYATDPDYCAMITAEAHSSTVQNAILKVITEPEDHELHRASDDGMPAADHADHPASI